NGFRERSDSEHWIFRGQRSSSWGLTCLLERLRDRYRPTDTMRALEDKIVREFQRKAHHYDSRTPEYWNTLEWLAMMRHYGAPTRLLDWTYSFFVAAYFACEDAESECAIWILNASWCQRRTEEVLVAAGRIAESERPLYLDGTPKNGRRINRLV